MQIKTEPRAGLLLFDVSKQLFFSNFGPFLSNFLTLFEQNLSRSTLENLPLLAVM